MTGRLVRQGPQAACCASGGLRNCASKPSQARRAACRLRALTWPKPLICSGTLARVEAALKAGGLVAQVVTLDGNSIKARFDTTDTQLRAKDAIQKALVPEPANAGYVVALNLLSRSPAWLSAMRAVPMYLGLDLRGGVHFMLQVDMQAALTKKAESLTGDIRTSLREKSVRHSGISRNGQTIEVRFKDTAALAAARVVLQDQFPDLQATDGPDGTEFKLTATIKPEAARRVTCCADGNHRRNDDRPELRG